MASVTFPPGASDYERATLVALELVRKQVADLPMALASTITKYGSGGSGGSGSAGGDGSGSDSGAASSQQPSTPETIPGDDRLRYSARQQTKSARKEIDLSAPTDPFRKALARIAQSLREADERFQMWFKNIRPGAALAGAAAGMVGTITKSAVGAFSMVGNMLQAKFAQVLGPAAIFGQVLNTSTAGFSVLGKAVQVLAAALGPVLLPITFALTVAIIEWADKIHDELMPAMDDWYQFVLSNMLPALRSFGDAIFDVVHAVIDAVRWIRDTTRSVKDDDRLSTWFAEKIAGLGESVGLVPEGTAKAVRDDSDTKKKERERERARPAFGGAPAKGIESIVGDLTAMGAKTVTKDKSGGMSGAMRDVLREFRMSIGPKASISSLSSVGNQATLAALNQSPFEARMLKWAVEALDKLERTARAVEKPAPVFPADAR